MGRRSSYGEDMDGLADVYETYAQPLYSYCSWLLPDPGAAAEALTRTFLIAATMPSDPDDPDKLRPWLYAVARGECRQLSTPGEAGPSGDGGAADPGTAGVGVTGATAGGRQGSAAG